MSSINKDKILEEGYINNATLVNFPLNSKSKYYDKDIKTLEYSKEKAKKYLSEVTLETNENINNIDKNIKNNKNTVQDLNKSNLETNNKKDNITDNETTTKEDKEKVIKEQISKLNLKIIVNKDNPERKVSLYNK